MADTHYFSTPILFPFDGTDGAVVFPNYGIGCPPWVVGGNTKISTAQSKFGGASAFFDGAGDYLHTASLNLDLGLGDFTWECWLRLTAFPDTYGTILSFNAAYGMFIKSTGVLLWFETTDRAVSAALSLNTWYHVAVTKANGIIRTFVNGVASGTTHTSTSAVSINSIGGHGAAECLTGYIDDLRVTKYVARYTANFTPPASAHDISTLPIAPATVGAPRSLVSTPAANPTFKAIVSPAFIRDRDHSGDGRITGTVKEAGSPLDLPVHRRVRLYRKIDGLLIREQWSAADGSYAFNNIVRTQLYYVLSFDHTGNYNGVIRDSLTPEAMP